LLKYLPKKRLGQNFLTDHSVINSILELANYNHDDCILEIGPGKGALTEWLSHSELRLKVLAVELDLNLFFYLQDRFKGNNFGIIHGDILKINLEHICDEFFGQQSKWRIIGNLPYNISTPLLFKLFSFKNKIIDQFFMLQNEVVDRMTATPGNKAYGRLSVILQSTYCMEKLMVIEPESFFPVPKVRSALVKMKPNQILYDEIKDWTTFSTLVTKAFSCRRKTIKNNLKEFIHHLNFKNTEGKLGDRPEDFSVEDYIELANQIVDFKNI
tara:strand:+ start:49 stop:858 length:810 start_codon:yes stop_codon:yes gene_type:complete